MELSDYEGVVLELASTFPENKWEIKLETITKSQGGQYYCWIKGCMPIDWIIIKL